MPRRLPYAGTSVQRLVNLINTDNNTKLTLDVDFTLGQPTPSFTDSYNTRVTFTPVNNNLFRQQSINYRRLSLSVINDLPASERLPIILELPTTIHESLSVINNALGINLTTAEVLDGPIVTSNTQYTLRIRDSFSSYAWLQSELVFTVNPDIIDETPTNVRRLEDGTPRRLEDGNYRLLEEMTIQPGGLLPG